MCALAVNAIGKANTIAKAQIEDGINQREFNNAEQMIDPATGGPQTAHTTNPVPFILVAEHSVTAASFKSDPRRFTLRPDGALQDIAPTMLGILGIPQPKEMTGHDLRVFANAEVKT